MKDNIIRQAISSLRLFLTVSQKRKGVGTLVMLLLNSFLDVFGLAALVPIIMVASQSGAALQNKYMASLYNALHFTSERAFLTVIIVGLFAFFVLKNTLSAWVSRSQAMFSADVAISIINRQMSKYLNLPYWYYNDLGSAVVTNNVMTIPMNYVMGILRPLLVFLSELAVISVIVVGIVFYKPLLLLILSLVLAPATWLTYRALRARSLAIGNRLNELRPVAFSRMNDMFIGYTELKLANRLQTFRQRIMTGQREMQNLDAESYLYGQLPLKVIELVAILGVVTIFLYALYFARETSGLIVLVGLFAAAAYRLMPSVNRMLVAMMQIKQNHYTIPMLQQFNESQYNEAMHSQQLPLPFTDSIVFDNLNFTFPQGSQPALSGISLRIRKGEKIGFVGSSGSGKTTLMNLLLRFYTEQQGSICVDGQPLTPQYLHAWYKLVGYVKQDTFLMEASIKDNITLLDEEPDAQRLAYAIEQASLSAFVASLPDGLDTFIGERGSKLSGGQRQRIGIARALYKRIELLVLDEATSALDNQTEREVNEAISKLSGTDITILIIAHRITTLRECDRIYELSGGHLVAEHQYEELIQGIV